MPRSIVLLTFFLASACAAILPEQLGSNHRASSEPVEITASRAIWDEYGFETAERANYGAFRLTAWQMKDPTGAFAAAEWLKASDTAVTTLGKMSIRRPAKGLARKPAQTLRLLLSDS